MAEPILNSAPCRGERGLGRSRRHGAANHFRVVRFLASGRQSAPKSSNNITLAFFSGPIEVELFAEPPRIHALPYKPR